MGPLFLELAYREKRWWEFARRLDRGSFFSAGGLQKKGGDG
jgi:hypothetical protein